VKISPFLKGFDYAKTVSRRVPPTLVRAGKTINKTANELRMSAAAFPDWDSVVSYLVKR
jgi:hypothetical protein